MLCEVVFYSVIFRTFNKAFLVNFLLRLKSIAFMSSNSFLFVKYDRFL